MKPPEVHSKLTSDGNDGLLALRPGSSGSFCQDGEPVLHRVISGLKTHHAPCQLNQNSPQSAISMFCDRTRHAFGPRAILARTEACVTGDLAPVLEALPIADLTANDYAAQGAHARGQRGRSRLLQLDSERTNLLIEGEQRRPVELKVGQYPGWQKLAQPVPALRLPPVPRGRQPMTKKQPAALRLYLLPVMDKLLTLTAPVPGPLFLFTGHPDHGQRVFVASQVTVQAQAECAAIASVSLHPGVAFVELLRSDDVAVCASLEQRAVECEAEPAGFIDDVNLKAFPQPRFDPGHKFRGSKNSRWPRRSVVALSRHHEFLPVDVRESVEEAARRLGDAPRLCLTTPTSMTASDSAIVRALRSALGSGTPVFGATAADQWRFTGIRQFFGREVLHDAVPFVLLAGDIRFSFAVNTGWSPLGRAAVVTEAEGNVVKAIDGQPATAFYRHYLGNVEISQLGEYPLAVFTGEANDFYLRACLSIDDAKGWLNFAGDIPAGSRVQITQTTRDEVLGSAGDALQKARTGYPGTAPSLLLCFTRAGGAGNYWDPARGRKASPRVSCWMICRSPVSMARARSRRSTRMGRRTSITKRSSPSC